MYSKDPLKMLSKMGADLEKADSTYRQIIALKINITQSYTQYLFRNTPLHWAVVQGNHTAVNVLVKLNVNLLSVNKENETPLDIAKRKGDLLSVRLIEMAARERGVLQSKFKQKLRENKVNFNIYTGIYEYFYFIIMQKTCRTIVFSLPFLAIFLSSFIASSSINYISKFELFACLGAITFFLFRLYYLLK